MLRECIDGCNERHFVIVSLANTTALHFFSVVIREKVIHYAPSQHEFWNTHVAVADSGFVDAFVLVHPSVPVRPNASTGELDAATRQAIQVLYDFRFSESIESICDLSIGI